MIKKSSVNDNNFLRFYAIGSPTLSNSQYSTGIHNGYLYKWRQQEDVLPVIAGDQLVFYTNFETSFGSSTISALKEVSCNTYDDYTSSDLSISTSSWGDNNLKITLTLSSSFTARSQKIRLGISSGSLTHVSNTLVLLSGTERNINNTHVISFIGTNNNYGYEWSEYVDGTDEPYKVRIQGSKIGVSYPSEKDMYTEATTGRTRTTRAVNKKEYVFEIYYSTEEVYDALSLAMNYNYFTINGSRYTPRNLEVEFQRNLNIFKGQMILSDYNYNRRVKSC